MARSSPKKPSPPKCRATGANLEGRDWVKIGGNRWLREAAEKAGKFIPVEHREGYKPKTSPKKAEAPVEPSTEEVAEVETEEAAAVEESENEE